MTRKLLHIWLNNILLQRMTYDQSKNRRTDNIDNNLLFRLFTRDTVDKFQRSNNSKCTEWFNIEALYVVFNQYHTQKSEFTIDFRWTNKYSSEFYSFTRQQQL